jgi:hypothetical protein
MNILIEFVIRHSGSIVIIFPWFRQSNSQTVKVIPVLQLPYFKCMQFFSLKKFHLLDKQRAVSYNVLWGRKIIGLNLSFVRILFNHTHDCFKCDADRILAFGKGFLLICLTEFHCISLLYLCGCIDRWARLWTVLSRGKKLHGFSP